MKPGQKINEKEIAEKLNVSRSPLREALRTVAKEELVTISPRKGAIVAEISVRELKEIFEVREMMELFAVDLIERHGVTDFEEMRKSLDVDAEQLRRLDIGSYLNRVTKFHLAMVRTSGNAKLSELYQVLTNSLIRYQRIGATIPDRMELSLKEHTSILEAFSTGRFKNVKELVRRHIEAVEQQILHESGLFKLEHSLHERG
jgi:DNA-binding GntR family transcriptional regulator